jgi:hypothetical protein
MYAIDEWIDRRPLNCSGYLASNYTRACSRQVKENNREEITLTYFKVLCHHSSGGIGANHEEVRIVSNLANTSTGHFPNSSAKGWTNVLGIPMTYA